MTPALPTARRRVAREGEEQRGLDLPDAATRSRRAEPSMARAGQARALSLEQNPSSGGVPDGAPRARRLEHPAGDEPAATGGRPQGEVGARRGQRAPSARARGPGRPRGVPTARGAFAVSALAVAGVLVLGGCPSGMGLMRPDAAGRTAGPHASATPTSHDAGHLPPGGRQSGPPAGQRARDGRLADALVEPERLRVVFVDVGQGDSIILHTASGKTVLVDAGTKGGSRAVRRELRALGVEHLDLVIMTHAHNDHMGGMVSTLTAFPPRVFLDPGYHATSAGYQRLLEFLVAHEIPTKLARRGRRVDLGDGVLMALLEPKDPLLRGTRSDANSNSVIARVTVGSFSLLLTGDAEEPSESRLLRGGGDLRCHVLKVAHHGGRYSTKSRFLNIIRPEIAVISVGAHNRYGHPTAETLGRLERHHVRVYRTDLHGTITLRTDGRVWTIETERQPEAGPVSWSPASRDGEAAKTSNADVVWVQIEATSAPALSVEATPARRRTRRAA